jgi:hypothetical protein
MNKRKKGGKGEHGIYKGLWRKGRIERIKQSQS